MIFRCRFEDLNGIRKKFDYQNCGPRWYLRFGHVEGPIRITKLGDIAPEIPAAQSVQNQNKLSFNADLEILSSFPRKQINTKVEDNFMAHNLNTEFALFGIRTWEIWHRKGRAANQENMDEADFMETKFASLARSISCKARWSTRPKAPQGHKYNPLGAQDGYLLTSIHRRAAGDHHKEEDAEALPRRRQSWRTARIDLHRMHLPHSTVPCLASWWSRFIVCPWSCNVSWYVVTNSCLYRNLLFLCWWCLMLKVWPPFFWVAPVDRINIPWSSIGLAKITFT
jgi:hypothetical protein